MQTHTEDVQLQAAVEMLEESDQGMP